MTRREEFPNDDDGEVLYQLALDGVDLTIKRNIDFSCYAKDRDAAKMIADDLSTYGYSMRIFADDGEGGSGHISVYASIFMLPDHDILLIEQKRLNAILRFHETSCDGWVTKSS